MEVRYFHSDELQLYESHHRLMAKSFLRLRKNSPDAFCLSAIGWDSIEIHIDKSKLMYAWRIFNNDDAIYYKNIYIKRFFNILARGVYTCESPVAQCINVCHKYGILPNLINIILRDEWPTKRTWRTLVNNSQR